MSTLKQLKEIPDLLTCVLEHEVTKTTGKLTWSGPKIDPDIWRTVLAFFRWTEETMQSESQVRFFVNPIARCWAAWAFPQEARTGMTAKELDTKSAKEQRALFPTPDWLYHGTAHHHRDGSAFQSSTDQCNESNQDGLHLTVGDLGKATYSLHARYYISGHLFVPDLSLFWDVGPMLEGIPKFLRSFLQHDVEDKLARAQMCEPPPRDYPIPDQWKENVIEVKREVPITRHDGGLGFKSNTDWPDNHTCYRSTRSPRDLRFDVRQAADDMVEFWGEQGYEATNDLKLLDWLDQIESEEALYELIEVLYRNDVSIHALIEYLRDQKPVPPDDERKPVDGEIANTDFGNNQLPE